MSKFQLVATSAFGLEAIVAKELKQLGFKDYKIENGKVTYITDEEGICKSNLWLRCADRVYIKVAEFKAVTFEELFQQTKAIKWSEYFPLDAEFPVADAKSVKSKLFSLSDIQSIVKKAIVESMKKTYSIDWFNETGVKYPIHVSILKDNVSIFLDTSGTALHKRGYREKGSKAPLKETLAAALIKISNWSFENILIDPFCGSGTIPIEAALLGRNIAPGLNRHFISEQWNLIPDKIWKNVRKKAYEAINYDKELSIIGNDIDKKVISVAQENSILAGVDDCIHFQCQNVSKLSSKKKNGFIICNPPYGERLEDNENVKTLYKEMGKVFRSLENWSYFIITSHASFEKCFGKKSNKNRKLYNGRIKCYYYQYYNKK